jgi:hypothetical protein
VQNGSDNQLRWRPDRDCATIERMTADGVKPWGFALARWLMLLATPIYSLLVISDAGLPRWDAPWIPEAAGAGRMLGWMSAAALVQWADALWFFPWLVRRKSKLRPAESGDKASRELFARFLVRLSLFHGASVCGAAVSFQAHDPRYAIVFAIPSLLMILFLPTPKEASAPLTA